MVTQLKSLNFVVLASLGFVAWFAAPSLADPLPGRDVLKFSQLPMDGTPIVTPNGTVEFFFGHDELSTAWSFRDATGGFRGYQGRFMADDFADRFDQPVVHVKWWGSYLDNNIPQPVDKFLISFESDVPATPTSFSHPGNPLLNQVVFRDPDVLTPGEGTYTEKPISPGGPPLGEELYEYNAELHLEKSFFQKPDTVYWLKIVALVDIPPGIDPNQTPTAVTRWGWHNRDYTITNPLASPAVVPGEHIAGFLPPATDVWHFQDDAVEGDVFVDTVSIPGADIMPVIDQTNFFPTHYLDDIDGPFGIRDFSKDLAFELYTVPEPASLLLLMLGLMGIAATRK